MFSFLFFSPVFHLAVTWITILSKEIHRVALCPFMEGISQSDSACASGKGLVVPGRGSAALADKVLHQGSSELLR